MNWLSGSGGENNKFPQWFFTISLLSPIGNERGPSFEQT